MLRRSLPFLNGAQFLGVVPKYLRSQHAMERAVRNDARRAERSAASAIAEGISTPANGPRPEKESMRKDAGRGRGTGRGRGRGGFIGGRGRGGAPSDQAMWPCACGKSNYERRTSCFACGAPKANV